MCQRVIQWTKELQQWNDKSQWLTSSREMMDQQLEDLDLVTFVLLNLEAEDEANKLELNNNQVSDFFLFQDINFV